MTYRDLLDFLGTLSDSDLEKTAQVHVAGHCLVVLRIDEGNGDVAPILDTGVTWVETTSACE
jgi:hypothetical protein